VIEHQIEHHAHAALVRLIQKDFEFFQSPVFRIHAGVIRDVIANVKLRRGEVRRQPQRIDAERLQVIQLRDDALEIANPVAVAIRKAARIDLVKHGGLPPFIICGHVFSPERYLEPNQNLFCVCWVAKPPTQQTQNIIFA
jgi:hypothetical protein